MTTKRNAAVGVLVVDDSPVFRAAVAAWVERQPSARLLGAVSNGREAVREVDRLSPDLVLMDIFMPEMDGFQATRAIKSQADAPIVILLSVSDGSAIEHEAQAAGADRFVPKYDFAFKLPGLMQELLGEAHDLDG